jgi:hypothetical protein
LFAPVITLKQRLPDLKAVVAAKEPERVEIAAQAGSARPRKPSHKKKSGPKKPIRKKSRKM